MTVEREERRPLKPGRVRAVDHELPHEVNLVHRLGVQQEGDFEGDVEGLGIWRVRWLLVRLDETRVRSRLVDEHQVAFRLLDCGRVHLPQLRLGRPEPTAESYATLEIDESGGAFAEQLARRELLVDFESDLQAERAVVHRVRKSGVRD